MVRMNPKSAKSLLIVTAIFPPVATSGIHRLVRMARYLTEKGVKVGVLTVDETTIAKKFKYDHLMLNKVPPDVEILRVPAYQILKKLIEMKSRKKTASSKKQSSNRGNRSVAANSSDPASNSRRKGMIQRLKDAITLNLNTPDNYALWIRPAIREGIRMVQEGGYQNILSSSPPGSSHVVCEHIKRKTGVHWIADFRDPWSRKQWYNPEMTRFKRRMIRRLEKKTIQQADVIILNTPELQEDYGSHYGELLLQKSTVIPNGYDPEDFNHLPSEFELPDSPITISHVGTFYRHRSPIPFLTALGEAIEKGTIPRQRFLVRFIGGVGQFATEVEATLLRYGIQELVEIVPPVPHQEAIEYMYRSHVLLIIQPGTSIQVPAKIYEYLATGRPMLAISARGATSRFVTENQLGWWAEPENVSDIMERLKEIDHFFAENSQWSTPQEALDAYNGKLLVNQIYDLLI